MASVTNGFQSNIKVIATTQGHDTIDGEMVVTERTQSPFFQSDTIPAQLNVNFGSVFQLDGWKPRKSLDVTLTHPPMGDDGRTQQPWSTKTDLFGVGLVGYVLEDEFELVTGSWTFRVRDGNT